MGNNLIKDDGEEAKKLLTNQFFQRHIWAAMHKIIDNRMLKLNTADDPRMAQDIIRYRQLLEEIESIAIGAVKRAEAVKQSDLKQLVRKRKKEERENKEPVIKR